VRAIGLPDGRVLVEEADGRYRLAAGRTDRSRVDATTEADLDRQIAMDPDDTGNDPAFWDHAEIVRPPRKERISVRLDADLLDWLRAQGPGYQTRLNAILRSYMEHARGASR
jgi:uncharacterized protein (DUF4415 family)